ncbi:hypothetical protein CB0940_02360 [Cercospora beticola]|uniref:Uncharacterized protein n=1 Tax=Cercospora beticola TaxID=122368 RepID=A0A2G5I1U9_CERBT|nr:hypothetical protein CB0940_02360 [Cercospora beticola]PIA98795.1 hypothetical protein CB0940_02360 [Cercospora beticola]WPA99493.1 hypothetical protein RHO25_004111 [Cercospora beticola]
MDVAEDSPESEPQDREMGEEDEEEEEEEQMEEEEEDQEEDEEEEQPQRKKQKSRAHSTRYVRPETRVMNALFVAFRKMRPEDLYRISQEVDITMKGRGMKRTPRRLPTAVIDARYTENLIEQWEEAEDYMVRIENNFTKLKRSQDARMEGLKLLKEGLKEIREKGTKVEPDD